MSTSLPYAAEPSTSYGTSTRMPLEPTGHSGGLTGAGATTLASYATSVFYNATTATSHLIEEEQCTFQACSLRLPEPLLTWPTFRNGLNSRISRVSSALSS